MKIILTTLLFLTTHAVVLGQDSLVLVTGKRIAYSKIDFEPDHIRIKAFSSREKLIFSPDSVLGFCSPTRELNYYIKPYKEATNGLSYQFLEKIKTGKINLYIKSGTDGQPEFTFGNTYLYMEKDGLLECVFASNALGGKKLLIYDVFAGFVEDDEESAAYVSDAAFKLKMDEVIKVTEYYNRRNSSEQDPKPEDVMGRVFLYRTRFQKPKRGISISLYGEQHKLYINDFIQLNLPVEYATKFTISDDYLNNSQLLSGDFTDQYFEVTYDKKNNIFSFEKKEGDEVQYEFYTIKKNVMGRID